MWIPISAECLSGLPSNAKYPNNEPSLQRLTNNLRSSIVNEAIEQELYELEELLAVLSGRLEQNQKTIDEIKQSIEKLRTRINTHE